MTSRRDRPSLIERRVQLGRDWLLGLEGRQLLEGVAGAADDVLRAVLVADPIGQPAALARLELERRSS